MEDVKVVTREDVRAMMISYREEHDMSQAELGAKIGKSANWVDRVERTFDMRRIRFGECLRLLVALGYSVGEARGMAHSLGIQPMSDQKQGYYFNRAMDTMLFAACENVGLDHDVATRLLFEFQMDYDYVRHEGWPSDDSSDMVSCLDVFGRRKS